MVGSPMRGGEAGKAGAGVADVLRASGLVDPNFYLASNPDVAAAGLDPVSHYSASGAVEARNPNPFFDSAWYLAANADVREAGVNPLYHYVLGGAAEGRSAGPDFDTAYYLAKHPDVGASGLNPLLHYLRHGRDEGRDAVPYDEVEAFEAAMAARQRGLRGVAGALVSRARADHVHLPLTRRDAFPSGGGLALPPLPLAERGGSPSLDDFERDGRDIRQVLLRVLPTEWDWAGKRCLDFGSGAGRVLRHLAAEAARAEIWGCDRDGGSIRWSVRNLSPPFRFFRMAESPTLPLEDSSFDLVYAVSMLNRVPADWLGWSMEIRRILKPGGLFFASFLGPTPMAERLGQAYYGRDDDFGMVVHKPFQSGGPGGPMVYVSTEWLRSGWGRLFDIDYIAIDGMVDDQSFVLARKPDLAAPARRQGPVLKPFTAQAFDPDAIGRIHPQVDLDRRYRDSYGIDVPARAGVPVEGWIALRDDVAERVEMVVDGRPVPFDASVARGGEYRDWGCPVANFSAKLDLSALARGTHRLEARLHGRGGRGHELSIPLLIR